MGDLDDRAAPSEVREARRRVGSVMDARFEEFVADLTSVERQQFPEYAAVDEATLSGHVRRLLEVLRDQLLRGDAPGAVERAAVMGLAKEWPAMQVPLDVRRQAFGFGARRYLSLIRAYADDLQIDPSLLLSMQDMAWEWGALVASAIAEVQRDDAVQAARRDALRHAQFLQDLSKGELGNERLAEEGALFGFDPGIRYLAVCASVSGAGTLSELERVLRQTGATSNHRVLHAIVDGELLAVAPQRPRAGEGWIVGVGELAGAGELWRSFRQARHALAAGRACEMSGVVDLAGLGPKALVTADDEIAAAVAQERFVLLSEETAAVERTVLALLELDQNTQEVAARLHLHPNTVRYRVSRFRELTGLDIRLTEDLVAAWWLLKWRKAQLRDAAARAERVTKSQRSDDLAETDRPQ